MNGIPRLNRPRRKDPPAATISGQEVELKQETRIRRLHRPHPLQTVTGRIIAGFGLLVLILVGVVAGAAWMTREHSSAVAEMDRRAQTVSLLQEAKLNGVGAVVVLQQYVMSGNEAVLPAVAPRLAEAFDSMTAARTQEVASGHQENEATLDQIAADASFLPELVDRTIALRRSGDSQGATAALQAALPRMLQLELRFDAAVAVEREEAAALQSRADRAGDASFWLLVGSGTLGGLVGLAASVLIARSILKPLARLRTTALAVPRGTCKRALSGKGRGSSSSWATR